MFQQAQLVKLHFLKWIEKFFWPAQSVAEHTDKAEGRMRCGSSLTLCITINRMCEERGWSSVVDAGIAILNTADPMLKAQLTTQAYEAFHQGVLPALPVDCTPVSSPPDTPARPADIQVVEPWKAPKRSSSVSLIHSLAHIESMAIDLSWDILARFHACEALGTRRAEFIADWLQVAQDEAKHFTMWSCRLEELSSFYGKLAVHDGLWQSAAETCDSLASRLAVVHMGHEAHGLDVAPVLRSKLLGAGDTTSAQMLEEIHREEISHVAFGVKWFKVVCGFQSEEEQHVSFQEIFLNRFHGHLRKPVNIAARNEAGLTEEWYSKCYRT